MKRFIREHLKNGLSVNYTAKQIMAALDVRNRVSSNAEIKIHLQTLFNVRYNDSTTVRDYVLKMIDLQTKLEAFKVSILVICIVH